MYQPMLMNKSTFDGLTKEEHIALMGAAAKAETHCLEEAKTQDGIARYCFARNGWLSPRSVRKCRAPAA